MAEPLRALFVNEGELGPNVLGHARAAETHERELGALVDARYRRLPPMGRLTRLAVAGVPGLERLDLDAHTTRWHLAQSWRARQLLESELAQHRPDVLHLHSHTLAFLATEQMRRIPTLVSIDATVWDWHEMGIWRRIRPYSRAALWPSRVLECRALTCAARVLAFTTWTKTHVERECPDCDVVVHHPGIDLSAFSPGPAEKRELPRVLFVGGRFVQKGGEDLLAALAPLLGRTLELDLVTPAKVDAPPGVHVHRIGAGDSEELVRLYRRADVFCLPTLGDAVPWAVIEALACGVPVVATDVGGIPNLVDNGRLGVLVKPRDRTALRGAVESLLQDPARRKELAAGGRARAEECYDARTQTRRLLELMHEIAAASPAG